MDGMFEIHFGMDIFNDYSWHGYTARRLGLRKGYIEDRSKSMVNIFAKLLDKQCIVTFSC